MNKNHNRKTKREEATFGMQA